MTQFRGVFEQANLSHVWNVHLAALRDLDSKHAGGGMVKLRNKRLRKFQGLRLRKDRTRKVL